ncbi:MAG: DUF3078 domain-containing protein [Balneolaceae bacterium]|nr:MAG: DUF3078 domain-containing protein [Balneolaceae bacterium]
MKKYLLLFAFIFLSAEIIIAQDSVAIPDTLQGRLTSWVVGINGSQASYSNWSQGGVNNIAATGTSVLTIAYKQDRFSYGFLLNTRYGKTKIEDEGSRKIDDRLFIKNRFLYDLGDESSDFKVFANIRFRTQFDKGFNYGAGSEGENVLISNFMAPAYFNQEAGLAYIPSDNFTFEAGLGLQQLFVRDVNLATTYGLDEGDRFRNEAGFTIGSSLNVDLATNVSLASSITTFTTFGKAISSTDVYFSNKLTGRINNFMNASLSLDLVYDDDFSNEIQVAQVLSMGVSFTLR